MDARARDLGWRAARHIAAVVGLLGNGDVMAPWIPIATYRVQLTPQFGFDDAAAIVPYLKALGISHLYASPFLKARAGTTHGYDIIDHTALNPEFGGEPAFERLNAALAGADMGLILDFVPNHMAVNFSDNAWWLDVLEWGPRSRYAKFFDIDWDMQTGQPRVLLPILGRPYGEALESGEIALRYDPAEGSFSAWYYDHRLPIGPSRYGEILRKVVAAADASDTLASRKLMELAALYRGPRNPAPSQAPAYKQAIAEVPGGSEIIARGLAAYDPASGQPGAVLALHYLLERQHYRLAYWRLAGSDINYRRFFDINTLAGLRVEEPEVFRAIHPRVLRMIADRQLQGLRLDHIDGLRDPQRYLRRLQRSIRRERRRPFYVIVEKILAEGEALPQFPGVAGTTGYEWLNLISRVLLDERGLDRLDRTWREESGIRRNFEIILRQAKHRVLRTILASEFTVLARLNGRIAAGHYSTRDYSAERLREALELYVLNFPVYRTYITAAGPSAADRAIVQSTIERARAEWFGSDPGIFDFLCDALTLDLIAPGRAHHSAVRVRQFAFKLQQFTGPLMAKSLEDTAFYRFHRLLALNEVGGDPAAGALSIDEFHDRMARRAVNAPHGLTATATHDTKRGEDARARLIALSELADDWSAAVAQWRGLNAQWLAAMPTRPTPAHEYMIYQALLGAWPFEGVDQNFIERMQAYVVKAAREGKEQTSWIAPNERYETALTDFVAHLLDEQQSAMFIQSFSELSNRASLIGALNGLTQLALKATLPGVPDFYQGTEFWDLSLVDPDNRRPVDFEARREAYSSLTAQQPDWPALAHAWTDGRIKLALTGRLLALRRQLPDVFTQGEYRPIEVSGRDKHEIIAYARVSGRNAVIVVAARLFGRATEFGRHWPSPGAWSASVDCAPLHSMRSAFNEKPMEAEANAPVGRWFEHLPLAIFTGSVAQATGHGSTTDTIRRSIADVE
jgi:(1->4)-alpha-D-glucan 1-alpha-D-glucosylmutase